MLSNTPFEVPLAALQQTKQIAPVRMAVAGADAEIAMESVRAAVAHDVIQPVLVGDESIIRELATRAGLDGPALEIVPATGEEAIAETAVALVREGRAEAVMKGNVHTDALMRAVVDRDKGLRTGRRLSHIFHMTVPGSSRVLYITDGAVNIAPDEETMLHIVNNAVGLAHAMGLAEPKVALLSATEKPLPAMPSSILAAKVAERANAGEVKGAMVTGPLAFDNAISSKAAALKGINHPVAGAADILVVPNIEMGNGLFKMMVWFMSATAAGVVLGAKVPIVLTSRADPPEARLTAAMIAALMAAKANG